MHKAIISLVLALVLSASLSTGAPVGLETVVDVTADADENAITVRHLLQHTDGLEDIYHSDTYVDETGQSSDTKVVARAGSFITLTTISPSSHCPT